MNNERPRGENLNSDKGLEIPQPASEEILPIEKAEKVTQKDPYKFEGVYKIGKKLGKGMEKTVYRDELVPGRVVGIYHEYMPKSAEQAKADFYLQKILHMLYPNIILDINARHTNPNVVIVPEIERSASGKVKDFLGRKPSEEEIYEILYRIRVGSGVELDNISNFIYDKNNNIVYADTPWSVNYGDLNFSVGRINKSIQKLPEEEQERAEKYLQRLIELSGEWRRKYIKP